jgi:hypothetical protein
MERRATMADKKDDSTYKVGFGKPPRQTRFRKGHSGNPKGRPRGKRNLATVLAQTLEEKIEVEENGVRKTITKMEAAIKKLVDKAIAGDLAALRQLASLAGPTEAHGVAEMSDHLEEIDLEIMRGVLKRLDDCK